MDFNIKLHLGVFVAIIVALFLAFVCFHAFLAFVKKPVFAISSSSSPTNTLHDDSFENNEHKRLLARIYRQKCMTKGGNPHAKPILFEADNIPRPTTHMSSFSPIKSPPQIFTSTRHSKPLSMATHVHDHIFTSPPSASTIPPQLPTISPDILKSIWESNSSLADNHFPLPKAKMDFRTWNGGAMMVQRSEAYIQDSKVRDSLDLEAQSSGKRANIVDQRFYCI